MLERYPKDVKLVHKFLPHYREFSLKAAIAALAADDQKKFWEFHDKLFENQGGLKDAMITEIAVLLKLDVEQFRKKMQDLAIEELINRDINDARELDIRGTPQVYINGRLLKDRSFPSFVDAIDKELKK
ncbi:hypothetical protein AOG1_18650 [Geobacter sp. AOG1]|nr:hypothetical protein AOG1_18650 [Geobacter sp. AOG1]